MTKPTCIDLFAGCGGLSMGLEQSGFHPVFVNELHPTALSTYLQNRFDEWIHSPQNSSNDILEITQNPSELDALARRLRGEFGEVSVVAGGPPCQGYSGIGHRRTFNLAKEEIPSNHLYREMAHFVSAIAPKFFVFENVKGLLTSRWTPDGLKGEIWEDVQTAFRDIEVKVGRKRLGYRIESKLLLAKHFGVPQNRPRVIMIGVREDVDDTVVKGAGLLPTNVVEPPHLIDLLEDLTDPNWIPGGATLSYPSSALTDIQRAMRTTPAGLLLAKGNVVSEHEYSKHSPHVVEKFEYMLANDGQIPEHLRTKKFAQRVLPERWGEKGPTITATSLPDDYVHFAQPRVPTVREWARLQTFPDWYQFAGGRTTGGRRRAGDPSIGNWTRDLPKYTQIGNAVPVYLARAIGEHLVKFC